MMAGRQTEFRTKPGIVPRHPAPPDLQRMVREAVGQLPGERPDPWKLAESLPAGISEAIVAHPVPVKDMSLKLPPVVPPPEPEEVSSEAAALTRVSLADVSSGKFAEWLLARLAERWPNVGRPSWIGRLRGFIGDNSYLFLRGGNAAGLAVVERGPNDEKPYVWPVFIFSMDGHRQSTPGERECIAFYREMTRWGRTLGATEVRRMGEGSDITPARLMTLMRGSEKRDEIFLRIK